MRSHLVRLSAALALAAAALGPGAALAAGSGGVTGPAFYVDGVVYRTVLTPSSFSGTGAPAHSFDTIYGLEGFGQMNVADAAPGDRDYNGGRWQVRPVTEAVQDGYAMALADFDANMSGSIDSEAELMDAVGAGYLEIGGVIASFECPVLRLPKGPSS